MKTKQVDSFSNNIRHTIDSENRVKRRSWFFLLLLWFFLLWSGSALWQFFEYKSSVQNYRAALVQMGRASIHVVSAAVKTMGRRRRQRPEFLDIVLKEILSTPHIEAAWLADQGGNIVTKTDEAFPLPEKTVTTGEQWLQEGVIVGSRVDIEGCLLGRGGSFYDTSGGDTVFDLFLLLSRDEMDKKCAADLSMRIIILLVFFVALAVVFLFINNKFKTKLLKDELSVAREVAKRNHQWALLGAGLAHETKNPIAVVRGLAQTISEGEPSETDRTGDARRIVHEVDRIVARIDEFLQFSRPVEPALSPVHLPGFLDEMAALIQADLTPRQGGVQVDSPSLTIAADEAMLRQIVLNLLVNAAQALDRNQKIMLRAREGSAGTVTLEVSDNGAGIAGGDLERIFEPYYTKRVGGTGLGLAIVKKLVEAHGWRITVKSREGEGTTVQISGIKKDET